MTELDVRTTRSFCRVCTSLCGILVETQGDQVLRVRGDRDHPLTAGYSCSKGRALPAMHHHPRRLERPLARVDGVLQPTSWEDCLDDLGTRLRAIIEEHGPASVGIFFGSGIGLDAAGYRAAEALQRAIGTPARFSPLTIDGTAKTLVATMVGGFAGLSSKPDYTDARLLLYVGQNPVVSHGHTTAMPSPTTFLRGLRERAEIWVVDPRRTETAALATGHLAPRPGTDHAVLAHVVRELLHDGVDHDLLARQTVDVDVLAAAVAPFTREHAAEVAGVPGEDLDGLVAAVRRAGRLAVETGTGITMSAGANVTQWLAWALMAITDSLNRPGGVWFHPGMITPLDGFELPVMPPEGMFTPGPPSRPDVNGFAREWPCGVLPDEIESGSIRAVLNLGGGLLTAFPEAGALRPALEKLELFVTLEIIENDNTALSTHVLPTKDQLERSDITLWDHLTPGVVAQYTPPVVEPVGERRSTWWVLDEIGKRLGHDITSRIPTFDGVHDGDERMLAAQMQRSRCGFDELAEARYVERPYPLPAPWVDAHVGRLGGWRLAPAQLVEQLAAMPESPPLCLVPRRQKGHLNAQFTYLGDVPLVLLHPQDAAEAGVADGDEVVVRSAQGELVGRVQLDEGLRPGAVSVPHGFETANVNLLTGRRALDPLTGMVQYSGIPVTLHPHAPAGA